MGDFQFLEGAEVFVAVLGLFVLIGRVVAGLTPYRLDVLVVRGAADSVEARFTVFA